MAGLDALKRLIRDLASQKLRTVLTTLGIVWGTTAVSLLLAFGDGLHRQMIANAAGLGQGIVITFPSRTSLAFEGLGKGRPIQLDERDVALLRERVRGLGGLSPEYAATLQAWIEGRTLAVDAAGVEPPFGAMRNMIPAEGGRWLNALDERDKRRVLFLGDELATQMFGADDPIGREVRVHGSPFLVVGVMKPKIQNSNYFGPDNRRAYMPASTFRALTGQRFVDLFIFRASRLDDTASVKGEVLATLARAHRYDPGDEEAMQVWDTTEGAKFMDTFMLAFRLFLGVVGSLTLVVGGIGVSNIMHVVVEERTREIGIKMALGARPRRILGGFLAETLLITAVGGALGLTLAAAICAAFPYAGLKDYVGEPRVSWLVGGATAAMLGWIGLLAGWFPARAAAALEPVVAMKT